MAAAGAQRVIPVSRDCTEEESPFAGRCAAWQHTMQITADGLPGCLGCGKCCHLLVELVVGDEEVPDAMVVEHSGIRCMEQQGDGACIALDSVTQLCTIYERRPQVCREFQRGSSVCRTILLGRQGLHALAAAN